VLYDVKAVTPEGYLAMTGKDIAVTEAFQDALRKAGTPTVVRQVVIPGISDSEEYMTALKRYTEKNLPTAQRVELLPYHKAGVHKYTALGLSDPLCHVPQMDKEETRRLQATYFDD
jgi:pyruvate formate lyase activating enzyme